MHKVAIADTTLSEKDQPDTHETETDHHAAFGGVVELTAEEVDLLDRCARQHDDATPL